MKRTFVLLFISVLTLFTLSVSPVSAKVMANDGGLVEVAKSEVIDDDLFIGAETLEIAGVVNGDVFAGAQVVKVTGVINGNLHVGTGALEISGTVKGNVYAGAQSILIKGAKVGGSVILGGATVNVDQDASIGGSVIVGAGVLTVDSQVTRSVYAGTGNLAIGESAVIGKDLYYAAGNEEGVVSISPDAKIAGSIYKSEVDTAGTTADFETVKKELPGFFNGVRFTATILSFVGALIIGFLYFKFFPKNFTESAGYAAKSFWKSMGVGFMVTIAAVPGIIILVITVVGIPVAGLAFLLLLLYSYLAKIVVGAALGELISGKFKWNLPKFGAFALGLGVVYLFRFVPAVGFLAGLAVFWVGLGALILQAVSTSDQKSG